MARIINPTIGVVVCPLLIEESQLLALDKVFDDFIEDRKAEEVNVTATNSKSVNRNKRSIIIYLSGGKTVKSDRFADAINQLGIDTEEPLGFRAHLEIGRVKASVSLTKLARNVVQPVSSTRFQVLTETPRLEFNVEPSDHQSAPDLFRALQYWAADLAPSTLLRYWANCRPLFIILFILWLVVGGLLGTPMLHVPTPSEEYADYRDEARKILSEGVNENNERKAIEIILAIDTHIPHERQGSNWTPGRAYWPRYVFGALVLFMFSFCPAVVIGIWKGKKNLRRWRFWIKWIAVTVLGTLVLKFVWDKILNMLGT